MSMQNGHGAAIVLVLLASLACAPTQATFSQAIAAYERGDHVAAARAARAPAEAGDPDAQLLLGDLYAAGSGVPQNFVLAHLWYNLAAAQGLATAARARDALAARMTAAQLAEAQSLARGWRPATTVAATSAPSSTVDAAEIQRQLSRLGYDPGPADGKPGRRTRQAVKAFQADARLPVNGKLTPSLLAALRERQSPAVADATAGAKLPATMLTLEPTPLYAVPDSGAARLAELPKGARVLTGEMRGSWVRVRALAPARGNGWLDSYALGPDKAGAVAVQPVASEEPAEEPENSASDFFGGLARGVTGLFGGGSTSGTGASDGASTIGIRGFDTTNLAAGRPNAAEFARLQDYAVSADEAGMFAAELGLRPVRVAYLPDPIPVAGAGTAGARGKDK